MNGKSSKADLNIYLAKPEVRNAADILKSPASLKAFELSVPGIKSCMLFVKPSRSNPPRWARFFASDIPASEFGQNSSTGAALFSRVGESTFVLTFGQGHHLLDSAKIEMNFGLKTVLNLVNVESLRSIDKSSFEQHPTQTRQQTGVAAEMSTAIEN